MIRGLGLTEYFNNNDKEKQTFGFVLKTKKSIQGPLRSIQKFVVILLTSKGSDALRPWFGTKLPILIRKTAARPDELKLFVEEQCSDAINQFFKLQSDEATQNEQTVKDVIKNIEIEDVDVTEYNYITITFRFTPVRSDSIVFSINYAK